MSIPDLGRAEEGDIQTLHQNPTPAHRGWWCAWRIWLDTSLVDLFFYIESHWVTWSPGLMKNHQARGMGIIQVMFFKQLTNLSGRAAATALWPRRLPKHCQCRTCQSAEQGSLGIPPHLQPATRCRPELFLSKLSIPAPGQCLVMTCSENLMNDL